MNNRTGFAAVFLIAGLGVQAAAAADFPNMVGDWRGTTSPVVIGSTGHAIPEGEGVQFLEGVEFTFSIKQQKGNDFAGLLISKNRTEQFVGSIREDKTEGVIADEDGQFEFKIVDPDTIDICYTHVTAKTTAANCYVLTRSK